MYALNYIKIKKYLKHKPHLHHIFIFYNKNVTYVNGHQTNEFSFRTRRLINEPGSGNEGMGQLILTWLELNSI